MARRSLIEHPQIKAFVLFHSKKRIEAEFRHETGMTLLGITVVFGNRC